MRFGGGGGTSLSLLATILVVAALLAVVFAPRRYLVIPLLLSMITIPMGVQIVVVGLHFMMLRIVLIFAWLRLIGDRDFSPSHLQPNLIDKLVILWTIVSLVTFVLLWQDPGALIERLGFVYNTFGVYFLFRYLYAADTGSVDLTFKVLALISCIVAASMVFEQISGQNPFSFVGGVPLMAAIRDGKLRAQGCFIHPILAGSFGATTFPLFAGMLWRDVSKGFAWAGMIASLIITLCSASSTPVMALGLGIAALFAWPIRNQMRALRWGVVLSLIGLHLVMKAPVWALIARIDLTGSSSGFHRYQLVDQTITHFTDWWLWGTKTTGDWGWDLWDTSNTFVETAIQGGLATLVLFIAVIVLCFRQLGRFRLADSSDRNAQKLSWILGAALFANLVAFFGITYFDQTVVAWYVLLAMISTVTAQALATKSSVTTEGILLDDCAAEPLSSSQLLRPNNRPPRFVL
jgi:hypothetical protein